MIFTGIFDAKFLTGTVRDDGHLDQEWIVYNWENNNNGARFEVEVPGDLKIGQP